MANKTISVSFKIDDGNGGFKKVTMEAGEFRKMMQATVKDVGEVKGSLVNFASASIGLDAIKNSFAELQNITQRLTDTYNVQVEAETKLETVMAQRMHATQGQVQSIKDLCSAQQQLGVIGDEVQLAGAQQLTTFLTQESALRTLIPAMNNLVAQQKGLNATGGDAVNIGNLLGKAMQGQTSALRRVGITFTEAEERAVKYGTEQQRAAALAQIITNNVGEMNAELAKTDAGRMKQMSNNVGDLEEKLGQMSQKLMPGITLINQMVMAGTNIRKVTMAFNAIIPALVKVGASLRSGSIEVRMFGTAWTASGVMAKTAAIVVKTAVWSIKTALISTGIGAAIWLVGEGLAYVVEKLNGVSDAAGDAKDGLDAVAQAQQAEAQQLKDARAQIALHISELENFNGSKEQEKSKIEELNSTYGTTMGYFSSISDWYKALKTNSEAYTKQIILEAQARSLADQIAAKKQEQHDILFNADGSARKYSKEREKKVDYSDMSTPFVSKKRKYEVPGTSDVEKAQRQYNTSLKATIALETQLGRVTEQLSKNAMPMRGADNLTSNSSKTGKSSKTDTKKINPHGSMAYLQDQISDIEAKIKVSVDPEEIMRLQVEKERLQTQIGALEVYTRIAVSGEWMTEVQKELDKRPLTLEVKVDAEGLKTELLDIPKEFKKSSRATGDLGTQLQDLGGICRDAGQAFGQMGEAFKSPELNIMGTIAQAVANLILSFGQAMTKTMNPWEWVAFGISGLAQLTGMIATVKNIGKFADGGIAFGPTLGLFGEYAGASRNPEVVAPLDRLRSLLPEGNGSPVIIGGEIRMRSGDLVVALRNETRTHGLSGKRSGIGR